MQNTLLDVEREGSANGRFRSENKDAQIIVVQKGAHGGLSTHYMSKGRREIDRATLERSGGKVKYDVTLDSMVNSPSIGWHEIGMQQGTRLAEVFVAGDITSVTQAEELDPGIGTYGAGAVVWNILQ